MATTNKERRIANRKKKRDARHKARGSNKYKNEQAIAKAGAQLQNQRGNLEQAGANFTNTFEGIQGASYDPAQAGPAQLGDPTLAQLGTLGEAQGYTAQGYDAAQTQKVQGANARDILSNPYANLQVSTAASDARAKDAERGQAALQEQLAQTGGGGATALLQASQASREGIRGDIQQQEAQNAQLRAQGQQALEQGILQQENFGANLDVGQQQFNVGAQNQAAQFGAQAQNQAAQFGAQAKNQFALEQFSAENQLSQFNAGAQNSFAQAQFGAANQFNLANQQAQNQAAQFGAESGFQAQQLQAQGAAAQQQNAYNAAANLYSQDAAANQAANQAEADRKAGNKALIGGIIQGVAGGAGAAIGSDIRLKEDINRVGTSPSGIPVYDFKYLGSDTVYRGVMSKDVPQATVKNFIGEYDGVDYSKIDVEFKTIK